VNLPGSDSEPMKKKHYLLNSPNKWRDGSSKKCFFEKGARANCAVQYTYRLYNAKWNITLNESVHCREILVILDTEPSREILVILDTVPSREILVILDTVPSREILVILQQYLLGRF